MKTSYLPRSRAKRPYARNIFFLAALFIVGAALFSFFDNLIISAVSPLWRAENSLSRGLAKSLDFFSTRRALVQENAALKEKVASLELELSTVSLVREQERALSEIISRPGAEAGVLAAILTQPPQSPYDLIVIDAGYRDSIVAGSKVFLTEGPAVGVISEVFPNHSRVKLFSTSGEKTQAVLERYQIPVTLEGSGAGNFKIVVPRGTEVEVGDRIISSEIAPTLLAVVQAIKIEPTDSFKEVLAKSPANIFSVRFVSVRP